MHRTLPATVSIIILILFSFSLYYNTLENDFIWDDSLLIKKNPYIQDVRNIPSFFSPEYWNLKYSVSGGYRPVREATFAVDFYFWGLNPAGYHLTNSFLHIANVLLIYFLVSVLCSMVSAESHKDDTCKLSSNALHIFFSLPFLTALFFAAYPLHTESVTYIKSRSDLLASLFFLLSLILFIKYLPYEKLIIYLLLTVVSLFSFILSVASKEISLTLPVILVLYIFCFARGLSFKKIVISTLPYFIILVLYFWFRVVMIASPEDLSDSLPISVWNHMLFVFQTICIYLKMLVYPFKLNAEHYFYKPDTLWSFSVILGIAGLVMLVGFSVKAFRRSKILFFGLCWTGLTLLPVVNIIILDSRPIAEQRLYLPSLGVCLILAWCLVFFIRHEFKRVSIVFQKMAVYSFTIVLIIIFGHVTIKRNLEWRDPLTFYSSTLADNPNSPRINYNLANTLVELGRFDEAIIYYRSALQLQPDHVGAHVNLGNVLAITGHTAQSIEHLLYAVDLNPDSAVAHKNLGLALFKTGLVEKAVFHYRAALMIQADVDTHNNLGLALGSIGEYEDAIGHFLTALRIKPDDDNLLNNLALTIVRTGKVEETIHCHQDKFSEQPGLPILFDRISKVYRRIGQVELAEKYSRRTRLPSSDQ